MYLGVFLSGDSIPLSLSCENATGTPTLPDAAPQARIYNYGNFVETVKLPICERYKTTAYFQKLHRLTDAYPDAGLARYNILYEYVISGTTYRRTACFDVGDFRTGDIDGTVIATAGVARPEAQHVLYETESGNLKAGRNPS